MRFLSLFLSLFISVSAQAAGPFDGEITIDWWADELSGDPFDGTLDVGTLNLRTEGWWDQKWGIRGGINLSDIETEGENDRRRFNLDLKRRLFSPTDNTFFAAGMGWERLRLENGESSQGIRLSLEGHIGIAGIARLYGESIWLPSLEDANGYEDLSGMEFETGVVFDPLPFVSIRAGYRRLKLDYSFGGSDANNTSQGVLIGTGIHW